MNALSNPPGEPLSWTDALEDAPSDFIVGKVLCVCAAKAIANDLIVVEFGNTDAFRQAMEPVDLLNDWIDDPTDERFERIRALIFDENSPLAEFDRHDVVWWALRVATSAVGCKEAGWALGGVVDHAMKAGVREGDLRAIAARELQSRICHK
jgi:hypothetical protein